MEVEHVDVKGTLPLVKATPLCGKFVSIQPCEDNPDKKTYLGLFIGEVPMSWSWKLNEDTKTIEVTHKPLGWMPAIYVFDLNKVVFGYQSWWGVIESEEQLRQITDADIQDIWYVKALKAFQEKSPDEALGIIEEALEANYENNQS